MLSESYNNRLFKNPVRRYLHLSRFYWLRNSLSNYNPSFESVIELGCYDGRAIDFLPNTPNTYYGFDRDWEGGLTNAKEKYQNEENFKFVHCESPDKMQLPADSVFSFGICMETLEHLSNSDLNGYLMILSKHVKGPVFITVPNEIGIFFGAKFLIKAIFFRERHNYSIFEFLMQLLGKSEHVTRLEHKGFNHKYLRKELLKYFIIDSEVGIPFKYLPKSLNSQIGWVLFTK